MAIVTHYGESDTLGAHMSEPLSTVESALLRGFRLKGVRTGEPLPDRVLRETVVYSGGPTRPEDIETALLSLEFRGLIAPGPEPLSATSWVLTESGDAIVNALSE